MVIICFMSLLKSNSLFLSPLERKSASKQNEKLLYCVVCTFDEASRKERHHVAIVCNALFLILVIVYTLLGQKTPKSLLPHRKLSLIFSLSPSHFLSLSLAVELSSQHFKFFCCTNVRQLSSDIW